MGKITKVALDEIEASLDARLIEIAIDAGFVPVKDVDHFDRYLDFDWVSWHAFLPGFDVMLLRWNKECIDLALNTHDKVVLGRARFDMNEVGVDLLSAALRLGPDDDNRAIALLRDI